MKGIKRVVAMVNCLYVFWPPLENITGHNFVHACRVTGWAVVRDVPNQICFIWLLCS